MHLLDVCLSLYDEKIEMKIRATKSSHTHINIETREDSGLGSHDVCIGVSIVIGGMPQTHLHSLNPRIITRPLNFSIFAFPLFNDSFSLFFFFDKVKSPQKNNKSLVLLDT